MAGFVARNSTGKVLYPTGVKSSFSSHFYHFLTNGVTKMFKGIRIFDDETTEEIRFWPAKHRPGYVFYMLESEPEGIFLSNMRDILAF